MELTTEKHRIIRSSEGEATEGKFTIKASAQAFRILSDRLYSDPITAIIRELSCNAYDGHVAGGNPESPFLMCLPTWQNPEFSIRDYGVGLSKDQIQNVYTTYFESTKSDSNAFIGCLGLGSKTPFSYTDSFLVESFYKGTKFTYTAFINEEGVPSLRSLGEEETKEQNGLRVSFAVKREDFGNFDYKAKEVFKWFKTRPIVKGDNFVFHTSPEALKSGDDWDLLKYNKNISYVRMGNVAYPLSVAHFPQDFPVPLKGLLANGIVFHFDIGDVDIAPSREALVYNKRTVASLKSRIERFAEEISEELNSEIRNLDCWYDACIHASNQNWFSNPLISNLIAAKEVIYKDIPLTHGVDITDIVGKYFNDGVKVYSGWSYLKWLNNISASKNLVVLDNSPKMGEKRLKDICQFNQLKNIIIIDSKKVPTLLSIQLIDRLGIDEKYIRSVGDLPLPPPDPKRVRPTAVTLGATTHIGKKLSSVWTLTTVDDEKPRQCWATESTSIVMEDKVADRFYIHIENFEVKKGSHLNTINSYSTIYKYMKDENSDLIVYGLTDRQIEKIQLNKTWINFDEEIRKYIKRIFGTYTVQKYKEFVLAEHLSPHIFEIIEQSKNKKFRESALKIVEIRKDEKIRSLFDHLTRFIHPYLTPSTADEAIKNARYTAHMDYPNLKRNYPNSELVTFIEFCKPYRVLLHFCPNLRHFLGGAEISIADAAKIIDLVP